MRLRDRMMKLLLRDDVNFIVTNGLPRRAATRLMGRLSKVEFPPVRAPSIALWRFFATPDLSDARETKFKSLHHAFTRALKDGARNFDPDRAILASPCDAIVGACGAIEDTRLLQIKGLGYTLEDLLLDPVLVERYRDGSYVTLRLTASMYHHFHAPYDGRVECVTYIAGDTWNVNPIALKRIEKLFCRNERAVLRMRLTGGHVIALVPVAAILVAGIRLNFLANLRDLDHDGPKTTRCDAPFGKGGEMGWFEHGSTIIVFAPRGFALCDAVGEGTRIRMGEPLMRLP